MLRTTSIKDIQTMIDGAAGVIFDNDGTLVDTMPAHYIAYVKSLEPHGIEFPLKKFYEFAGMPADIIIDQLKNTQGKSSVSTLQILSDRNIALKESLQQVKGIEPVVGLLRYAQSKGKKMAVASGGEREDVIASLEAAGIDWKGIFNAVVTREDVKKGKPDPETFLEAAKRIGVQLGECVGFEDGDLGLLSLKNGGAMGIVDVRELSGYPKVDVE